MDAELFWMIGGVMAVGALWLLLFSKPKRSEPEDDHYDRLGPEPEKSATAEERSSFAPNQRIE